MQLDEKFDISVDCYRSELATRLRIVQERFKNRSDAAKAVGIAKSTMQLWCEGGNSPPADKLAILANKAGVSLAWLVSGEGEMFPGAIPPSAPAQTPAHADPGAPAASTGEPPDNAASERFLDLLEFFGPQLDSIASKARVPRARIEAFRNREQVPDTKERDAIIKAAGASQVWVETGIGMLIPATGARLPEAFIGVGDRAAQYFAEDGATTAPPAIIDPAGMAAIADHLEGLYKEKGLPFTTGLLAGKAAEIARDVALVARTPDEVEVAIAMALLMIRRALCQESAPS